MKHPKIINRWLLLCVGAVLLNFVWPLHASAANNWVSPSDAYGSEITNLDLTMNNDPPAEILLRPYYFIDNNGVVRQVNANISEVVLKAGESADISFTVEYDGGRVESNITLTYNDKDDSQSYPYRMFTFTHDTKQYFDESVYQDLDGEGVYHDSGAGVALYRPQDGTPCLMFSIGGLSCLYMEIVGIRGLAGGDPGNVSASDDYGSDSNGLPLAVVIAVGAGALVIVGLVVGKKVIRPKAAPVAAPKDVIITDPATGAQTRYVRDPVNGEWVDPERGSVLDPDHLPESMQQRQEDRKWVDQQNKKLQTGDNAFDKELAEAQTNQHATDSQIDELIRISQRAGAQPQSELTDKIRKNVHQLVDQLIDGNQPLSPAAIERVNGAFIKTATGKIISQAELPKVPSDLSLFGDAFINEVEEVSRNQTASAVFFRTIFAIPTGGGSELFFQSHKGYLRMRDYVDDGGNTIEGGFLTASWGAVKDFAVSKTADKGIGKVSPSLTNLKDGKIIYNQVKRLVKGDITTTDKMTLDIDGKVRRAIKRKFN